jgi:hypothetical protein
VFLRRGNNKIIPTQRVALLQDNKETCLVDPSCSLLQEADRASLPYVVGIISSPDNGQGPTLQQELSQTFTTTLSLSNNSLTRLQRTTKGSAT